MCVPWSKDGRLYNHPSSIPFNGNPNKMAINLYEHGLMTISFYGTIQLLAAHMDVYGGHLKIIKE